MASTDSELEELSESGVAPKRRIASASKLIEIVNKFCDQDDIASKKRARGQALVDGESPYSDKELTEKGLGNTVNVNFGEANAKMEAALVPYFELVTSVPRVPNIVLSIDDINESFEDSEIASEEFDWFLKEWADFHPNMQLLQREYVGDGVGVALWIDERTVFWEPIGLNEFKIDRDTKASDSSIEISGIPRTMSVTELHDYIRDPKTAKLLGWNVNAVRMAIWKASTTQSKWQNFNAHWEDFQKMVKENDLYAGEVSYKRVDLIYGFNKEYDRKYTQTIAVEGVDDFIYERPSKYSHVGQCFTSFTYGVGGGTFHTIRGLKQKMYNHIQISNRILCSAAQQALTSGQIQLTGDAKVISAFRHIEIGPYSFIPSGLNPLQLTPNTTAQTVPIYQLISKALQDNTGVYNTRSSLATGSAVSATEAQQQARRESLLGSSALSNFYNPFDRLLTEQFRRMVSPILMQSDRGGQLAYEFRRRCHKRGVTIEKLRTFRKVFATRALGNGDPVISEETSKQLMQLSQGFDEQGKNAALTAAVAKLPGVGYDKVRMFVPKGAPRKLVDFDIANLENNGLRQGIMPVITGEQNHMSHVNAHMPLMDEYIDKHRQQQISDEDAMNVLGPTLDHTTQHVDAMSTNALRQRETNDARQLLQNASAYIMELQQQVINRMMAQQKDMQGQAEQGGQDPKQSFELAKLDRAIALEQMKGKNMQEKHQQEMEAIKQKMALTDITAKTKIAAHAPTGNSVGHPPLQP